MLSDSAEKGLVRLTARAAAFIRRRDQNKPYMHLRELETSLVQKGVSLLLEQVQVSELKSLSYNRQISAVSTLYLWALEPTRSVVSGVPRKKPPKKRNVGIKAGQTVGVG